MPEPENSPVSALRFPAFRKYWAAQIASLLGTWMQLAAQGWLIVELTSSPALIGAVACAGAAPILLLSLLGGRIASRIDRRKLLVWTQAGLALQAAAFGVLVASSRLNIEALFALAVAFGTLTAFDLPAQRTFWADLVPLEGIKSAVSLNAAAFHGSRVIGPMLAGFMMQREAHAPVFFVNAASYLITIGMLLSIDSIQRVQPKPARSLRDLLLRDRSSSAVRFFLGFVTVNSLCVFPYLITFVPALVRNQLGGAELTLGALLGCSGAGALLGALALPRVPDHLARRVVAGGTLLAGTGVAVLASARSLVVAAPVTLLLAAALALSMSMALARLQTLVPAEQRGTLMGLHALSSTAIAPFAAAFWGLVGEYTALPVMLRSMAAGAALATLLVFALARARLRGTAELGNA